MTEKLRDQGSRGIVDVEIGRLRAFRMVLILNKVCDSLRRIDELV